MDIQVREVGHRNYKELRLKEDNTTIQTGLMDDDESREMALTFLRAAEDLLPDSVERDKLIEIQEVL